jgi:hypothetical protein
MLHEAKKSLVAAAYSATFSAPTFEYGCSAPSFLIASSGSVTASPVGSLPRRSKEPEEKCIALCPVEMIAVLIPAF